MAQLMIETGAAIQCQDRIALAALDDIQSRIADCDIAPCSSCLAAMLRSLSYSAHLRGLFYHTRPK
jgi:hypothetical protein